jgi:hypothetical protein
MRLAADTSAVTLEVTRDRATSTLRVNTVPIRGFAAPRRVDPPLYRQRAGERYWWTYVADSRTIFVKYNQCVDDAAFRALSDSVAKAIDEQHPLRVVVDIRDNSGGSSSVVQPLIDAIASRPAVNRGDALYVIFGRATFSSGLMAAIDFKHSTKATLIGEPTGEHPNHYGEVQSFELPNSRVHVNYSTKFHQLVDGNPDAFYPDVSVPPTAQAFIAGHDPGMEWILAHSRTSQP